MKEELSGRVHVVVSKNIRWKKPKKNRTKLMIVSTIRYGKVLTKAFGETLIIIDTKTNDFSANFQK